MTQALDQHSNRTIDTIPPTDVLRRLGSLERASTADLKQQWRELFGKEPPAFSRTYLQSRLAYRIQELAYGGLKPETVARLEALGEKLDGGNIVLRRIRADDRPIAGTRLVARIPGRRARRHGAGRRVRVRRPALSIPLGDRPRHHRHALERLDVLRSARAGRRMSRRNRTEATAPASPAIQQAPLRGLHAQEHATRGWRRSSTRLDAQRDACEAYVASQRAEGWVLVHDHYDDGGFSGGTLERPALRRLLADIEAGRIDVVVVYKIDRLSRSLIDFTKLVEVFDRHDVTFVSVTQSFNTTTSMGRLTLNILLSFAQFEREVIGERIRDKFAASRARGMWMGGSVPLGYDVRQSQARGQRG